MGYLFLFFVTLACAFSRPQAADPFSLEEASVQEHRSGVHGGGNSKDYAFTLLVHTDQPLFFDSAWVEGQWLGLRIEKDGHLLRKDEKILKNDKLILHAAAFIPAEAGSSDLPEPVKTDPPVNFMGKALIRYQIKGQQKYFPVKEIRELPLVIMP